ncbi:MAG: hypothetical protein IT539_00070 [Bradyrhizobiaceae bacterium]|nr:hypothetical protein [Bradyrhizobiaceae bacterium]
MADIVLGIGTSHSPLLNSPAEDYPKHAEIDAKGRKLLDGNGTPTTYGALLEAADPSIEDQIRPEVLEQRAARCTANIERLARAIADAKLDALIVVGDDQHEQFFDDNMPAILGARRSRTIRCTWMTTHRNSGARRARSTTRPKARGAIRLRPSSACI